MRSGELLRWIESSSRLYIQLEAVDRIELHMEVGQYRELVHLDDMKGCHRGAIVSRLDVGCEGRE